MRTRTPVPVTTNDIRSFNLLNSLQILYLAGRINQINLDDLNRHLGRRPGEPDSSGHSHAMLFEQGLRHRVISSFDLALALDRKDGYRYWRTNLPAPVTDSPEGREQYRVWCQLLRPQLEQLQKHYAAVDIVRRDANHRDLQQLVAEGWLALVREGRGNHGTNVLFFDIHDNGFLTYHPNLGLRIISNRLLGRFDLTTLQAWQRPAVAAR